MRKRIKVKTKQKKYKKPLEDIANNINKNNNFFGLGLSAWLPEKDLLETKLSVLHEKLNLMNEYLLFQFNNGDYHGVADAAMDIREILREIKVTKELLK